METSTLHHAIDNAQLLRALPWTGKRADLAAHVGKDHPNLNKTLNLLEEDGLLVRETLELTAAGREALDRIDVLEGRIPPFAPGDAIEVSGGSGVRLVPLDGLRPDPLQPRKVFDEAAELEMAASIGDRGIQSPLLARPVGDDLMIVFGERRWRGARKARELGWVPADFHAPVQVRAMSDREALEAAAVENMQREDLHWMEEAAMLLALSDNRARPASEVERIVGQGGKAKRSRRSIQEMIKLAAELSDAERAACLLAPGTEGHITYDQARFLVGNRAMRPALDLNARQALALLELFYTATTATLPDADHFRTPLFARPGRGPLLSLADLGHVEFGFDGEQMVATVALTDKVKAFLTEHGAWEDCDAAVKAASIAALGELETQALERDALFATPELNAPRTADPATTTANALTPPPDDGPPKDAAQPLALVAPPAPPAAPEPVSLQLSPARALILLEVAHKVATDPQEATGGIACALVHGHGRDPLAMEMAFDRLLFFIPERDRTLVALTPTGVHWRRAQVPDEGANTGDDPTPWDAILDAARRAAMATLPPEALADWLDRPDGAYATGWLNPPPPALSPSGERDDPPAQRVGAEGPAPAPAARPATTRDAFTSAVLKVNAEEQAMRGLAGAVRHLIREVEQAGTRRLKPDEVATATSLGESALERAAPYLSSSEAA